MQIKTLLAKGKSSLNSTSKWLKGGFNKWRLAFLIFAAFFAFVLLYNLSYNSIQWDEVTHLIGGLSLLRGDFPSYFNFNAFYPPMYDLFTAGFFSIAGINVLTARLISVLFSLLSIYAVFEFGYRLYSPKIGLLASIFLALMPGFIWLSRLALIETMLIFFFTITALFFFAWLRNGKNKYLILSGLTLGLGILTKYQMIIVGAIMLTSLVILGWGQLKKRFSRFPLLILITIIVIVPWAIVSYQVYASRMFETWLYALNVGNPTKSLYSLGLNDVGINRFPHFYAEIPSWTHVPIFYLLENDCPLFRHTSCFLLFVRHKFRRSSLVLMETQNSGQVLAHMVCSRLPFLHRNTQQTLALHSTHISRSCFVSRLPNFVWFGNGA